MESLITAASAPQIITGQLQVLTASSNLPFPWESRPPSNTICYRTPQIHLP